MAPTDNNPQGSGPNQAYDPSSLEQPVTVADLSTPLAPDGSVANRSSLSPFRWNKRAFVVTASALGVILLSTLGAVLAGSLHNKSKNSGQPSVSSYAVGNVSVNGVRANQALKVGEADHLAVNGQLQVSNTLVLAPTGAPTAPSVGQIYFDKTSLAPFYYNGKVFVSLAPQTTPANVSSLGGATGAIAVGSGLTVVNSTVVNTGVLSVNGTPNQIGVVNNAGNITLSLAGVQAGGVLVGGSGGGITTALPSAGGQCLISDPTTNLPEFGSCTGQATVNSIKVGASTLSGALTVQGTGGIAVTASGQTITIDGSSIAPGGNASYGATHAANHIAALDGSGNIIDSQLATQAGGLQFAGSAYFLDLSAAGTSTFTVKNSTAGQVANLSVTGGITAGGAIAATGDVSAGGNVAASGNVTAGGNVTATGTVNGLSLSGTSLSAAAGLSVSSGGTGILTIGSSTRQLILQGDNTSIIRATSGANTTSLVFTAPTSNETITIPDATGTVCLSTNNCGFAVGGSGVNSLNGLSGALALQNAHTVAGNSTDIFIDNAKADASTKGIASFNSTNFSDNGSGVINTIQPISQTSNVTFGTVNGLTLAANSIQAASGALSISSGGVAALTVGTTSRNLTLQGDSTSTISVTSGANTTTLNFTAPTTAQTITVPNASGTICLSTNNCGFAVGGSGVNSLNGLSGALAIQNAHTNAGNSTDIFIDNTKADGLTKGIATFNATNFTDNGSGVINTVQPINTAAAVTFQSLSLGAGDLTLSTGHTVFADNLHVTAGGTGLGINAGAGNITFTNSNGANSFLFPTTGGTGQVICTTGITCASGGGQAVILEPSGVQSSNSSTTPAIFINKASGTSNLVQLQAAGANAFVINSSGAVSIPNASGLTLGTAGPTGNTGAILFKNSTNANTLTLQSGTTAGNLTFTLPTADGSSGQCLSTDGAGNLSFTTCLSGGGGGGGVTFLNSQSGSVTLDNATGAAGHVTINNAVADGATKGIAAFNATNFTAASGVVNTAQDINTAAAPIFKGITLQGAPTASATASLIQIAQTIAGGNAAVNGGTYIGLNAPATGAGSAADFLNFQLNGVNKLLVTNAGQLTTAGQITVTSGGLTVSAGGLTVTGNSTIAGTLSGLTGLSSSGTVTFSGLSTGIVQANVGGTLSSSTVDRNGSLLTGTLNVGNGGTGQTSFTANGVIYGNGTSGLQVTPAGTSGQALIANISGVPTFTTIGGDASLSSTGSLTVNKLQGTTVTLSALASGDVLQYNGTAIVNGHITNSNLTAGTFSNITGTGALSAGSIVSGFGTISTGNNITTTAVLQGNTLNVGSTQQLAVDALGNLATSGTLTSRGLVVTNGTNANSITIQGTAPAGGSVTIGFPGSLAAGIDTFCLQAANNCTGSATSLQAAYTNSTGGTTPEIVLDTTRNGVDIQNNNATPVTGSLFAVRDKAASGLGTALFSVANTGATSIQTTTNSATAFQIQNAAGGQLFNVDSSYANITINSLNNAETGAWQSNTNTLPALREYAADVTANGYAYVIGGDATGTGTPTNTVYYAKLNADGSTGAWQTNANTLPANITRASAVTYGNYVYILGGYDGSNSLGTIYYAQLNADGSTGAWQTNPTNLATTRHAAMAAVANGYVYLIGGLNGLTNLATVHFAKINADGTISSWTATTSLPATRYDAGIAVANGSIYVVGGILGASAQTSIYHGKLNVDGTISSWTTSTNPLPAARGSLTATAVNGHLYAIGGLDGSSTYQSSVFYSTFNSDGTIGNWTTAANSLPANRAQHGTVVSNGYIYVIGGTVSNGGAKQSTVYYAPLSRTKLAGSLDLVGVSQAPSNGQILADEGGQGGSLTAGNTRIVGTLNIEGAANFLQGVGIGGTLSVTGDTAIKSTTNSTTAFQVQNASGKSLFGVDTSNTLLTVNGGTSGDITPWTLNANSLPASPFAGMQSVTVNGYAYAINNSISNAFYYAKLNADGSIAAWTTGTSLPGNVNGASIVTASGYIYVIGGNSATTYYGKVNPDGSVSTWNTSTSTLPQNKYGAGSVVANGYIYEFGGAVSNAGIPADTNIYLAKISPDGTIGPWATSARAMPIAQEQFSTFMANGYVYMSGGFTSGSTSSSTVYYAKLNTDGTIGAWATTTASLPAAFTNHSSLVLNGYVYTFSLNSGNTTVYYAQLGSSGNITSWQTSANPLPTAQNGSGAFTYNGYLYVTGGGSSNRVYYASIPRLKVATALDLVGLDSGDTNSEGTQGASLTAGNTRIAGTLDVAGSAYLAKSLTVAGQLSVYDRVAFQNTSNSTTAFQVQDTSGNSILGVDTLNSGVSVNSVATTTNALSVTANSLTSGSGLNVTTSSPNYTSGNLISASQTSTNTAGTQTYASSLLNINRNITANVGGSITKDTATVTASVASASSLTFSFTQPNTPNHVLVVTVSTAGACSLFTPTYNGTTMTQVTGIRNSSSSPNVISIINIYTNAPVGTANVVVTTTSACSIIAAATSFSNVSQSSPVGTAVGSTGNATSNPTIGVTSNATDAVVDALSISSATTPTVGAGQTQLDNLGVSSLQGASSYKSGASSMTWTASNISFAYTAIPLHYVFSVTPATNVTGALANLTSNCTNSAGGCTDSSNVLSLNQQYASATGAVLQIQNSGSGASIQGGNGSGTNIAGSALVIAGGQGTGNANGGGINLQVAIPGTSGSSSNALTTVFSLSGTDGSALFKGAANSASAFQVQNATGGQLLNVDSANSNITLAGNNSGEVQPWSTNANALPNFRYGHTSVVANGYVYVIGGINQGGVAQTTVYYAKLNSDGSTGAWQTNANALPAVRMVHTSVAANGYVYVIGGTDNTGTNFFSTVYYAKLNADGSTGTWQTAVNSLPAARQYASSVVANGYVYVIGGHNGTTAQSTVYYAKLNSDGSVGSWSTANALPGVRYAHTSVVANGYVYVIAGNNASAAQNTVYYAKLNSDGSTGAWQTAVNALPTALSSQSSVVVNGYVYAIGGGGSQSVYYAKLNSDGSTGTWQTAVNALPDIRYGQSSVVSNGYIYAIGGHNATAYQVTVYYTSTSRINVGGSLDLIGLQGQDLADTGSLGLGSTGGSITAGDATFVGNLQVAGQSILQGVAINSTLNIAGSATIQTQTNNSTAFQVQNAAGADIFTVDTTNGKIGTANQTAAATSSNNLTIKTGDVTGTGASNSGSLTIDTGSSTNGTAGNISIGTGAYSHNVTIGNTVNTSKVTLQGGASGSGGVGVSIQTAGTAAINIGTDSFANTIQIGATNLATGTQTINIGNNTTAGTENSNITIGSAVNSSPVVLQSGTGGITATSTNTTGTGISLQGNSITTGNAVGISTTQTIVSTTTQSGNVLNVSRANTAGGAIAQDGSTISSTGTSSVAFTVTDHGDNSRLLLVAGYCADTPSYNGSAFTQVPGSTSNLCFFYLKNPTIGTFNVTGIDGTGLFASFISSWYNVSQTTPIDTGTNNNNNASITLSPTTTSDKAVDYVLSSSSVGSAGAGQSGSSQTASSNQFGYSSKTGTSSSTTLSWTGTISSHFGAVMHAASATLTVSGALANLSNSCTVALGTCTDSANILNLNQQYASATGAVLNIQNAGTGVDLQTGTGKFLSGVANGASAIGYTLNTGSFTTAGAKLLSVQNYGVEKFAVDKDGNVNIASGAGYFINGANINTAGTLSNVAYLNQTQTFTGANTFANTTNSTTAFQIQNSSAVNLLTADTTNTKVTVGSVAPTSALFATKADSTTGSTPWGIAAGDFNGDGLTDMIVVNNGSGTASVFINNGSGIPASASYTLSTGSGAGSGPVDVAVGDFNGDGKTDAIITNGSNTTASVFINTGTGLPTSPTYNINIGSGAWPYGVAVGDFNGDGKTDAAVVDHTNNKVQIFINSGSALPTTASYALTTGSSPSYAAVGDFNGDGLTDMIVTNNAGNTASVYINSGSALPTTATSTLTTGTGPEGVAVGDFNGDGKTDAIITNNNANAGTTASVYINGGSALPTTATSTLTTGGGPWGVATGDFNGDGKTDVVINNESSNTTASVYINSGSALPTTASLTLTTGTTPMEVAVGDFNGDGRLDIATANKGSGTASVFLNTSVIAQFNVQGSGLFQGNSLSSLQVLNSSNQSLLNANTVNMKVSILGTLQVQGAVNLTQNVTIGGTLNVSGNTTLGGTLNVTGLTTLSGGLVVSGTTKFGGYIMTNNSSTPTAAVQSAAGTGATCTLGTSNDTSGTVVITAGAATSVGAQCVVTFGTAFPTNAVPRVVFSPTSGDGASVEAYVGNFTNASFSVNFGMAPTATHVYAFDYFVIATPN